MTRLIHSGSELRSEPCPSAFQRMTPAEMRRARAIAVTAALAVLG